MKYVYHVVPALTSNFPHQCEVLSRRKTQTRGKNQQVNEKAFAAPGDLRDESVDTSGSPRSRPLPRRALVDPIELQLVPWADKDEVGEATQHPVAIVGIAWAPVAPKWHPLAWNRRIGQLSGTGCGLPHSCDNDESRPSGRFACAGAHRR